MAINVVAISLMRYSGGIVKWSQECYTNWMLVATKKLMFLYEQ